MATITDPACLTPPEFALHWAEQLGTPMSSLAQLKGGINNQVYRCGQRTARYVIKGYAPVAAGERDRMQAEVEFLRYTNLVAASYVPMLLHEDKQRRCLVLEYIDGVSYSTGTKPSCEDIDAACNFLEHLNKDLALAREHVSLAAAEGFLRITDHLQNIEERLAQMTTDHLPHEQKAVADGLLGELVEQFGAINLRTQQAIQQGDCADAISTDSLIISPSDFGFHNSIKVEGRVKFIDFEFAGWDDPAKALADFVLQPTVKVGSSGRKLASVLSNSARLSALSRLSVLGPVLRLKWLCIILAILQPDRLAQLLTIQAGMGKPDMVAKRLDTAAKYLADGGFVFGLH